MYQHKNSVKQARTSHWNKLELTYLPPALMKVTHLMSTRPNMQEAWERFKKIGYGHFVWCVLFLQCSEIESDCFEIFQSQFRNTRTSPFKFLSCSVCWSKKEDGGMLKGNAKRIFCDNVTCFGTNKRCSSRIGVICKRRIFCENVSCFGTNKCCSNRSHLQECFNCSSLLACKGTAFNLFSN